MWPVLVQIILHDISSCAITFPVWAFLLFYNFKGLSLSGSIRLIVLSFNWSFSSGQPKFWTVSNMIFVQKYIMIQLTWLYGNQLLIKSPVHHTLIVDCYIIDLKTISYIHHIIHELELHSWVMDYACDYYIQGGGKKLCKVWIINTIIVLTIQIYCFDNDKIINSINNFNITKANRF